MSTKSGFLELGPERQSDRSPAGPSGVAIVIGSQILDEFDHFYREFTEITKTEVPTLRALYACVSLLDRTVRAEGINVRGTPR